MFNTGLKCLISTAVGNSAGAFGVSDLMISPMANGNYLRQYIYIYGSQNSLLILLSIPFDLDVAGLFHSAITQSGGSLCKTYTSKEKAKTTLETLAEESGCSSRNRTSLLQCLREKEAKDLAVIRGPLIDYNIVVEDFVTNGQENTAFMPDTPYNMLKNGHVNKVPWIIGVNSAESCSTALRKRGKLTADN
jgi:carboxylesterase type B